VAGPESRRSGRIILQGFEAGVQGRLIEPEVAAVGEHAEALVEQPLAGGDVVGQEAGGFLVSLTGLQDLAHGVLKLGMVELAGDAEGVG